MDVGWALQLIANCLKFALVIVAVLTMFFCYQSQRKFEVATIAIGSYILFQNVSYAYVLIFTFILFALYLNAMPTYRPKTAVFYAVIFITIFLTTPYFFKFCLFQFLAVVVLVVKAILTLWVEYVQTKHADGQEQFDVGRITD